MSVIRFEFWLEVVVVLGEQCARDGEALDLCPLLVRLVCALKHHHVRVLGGGFVQPLKRLTNIFSVPIFTIFLKGQLVQRWDALASWSTPSHHLTYRVEAQRDESVRS